AEVRAHGVARALAGLDDRVIGVDHVEIVALAADQYVAAIPAGDEIIATLAVDDVVSGVTVQVVEEIGAIDRVVAGEHGLQKGLGISRSLIGVEIRDRHRHAGDLEADGTGDMRGDRGDGAAGQLVAEISEAAALELDIGAEIDREIAAPP